jgi:hypothetical protein
LAVGGDVQEVRGLANLTPGDFAAVSRRLATLGGGVDSGRLLEELRSEVRVKGGGGGKLGFRVAPVEDR